MNGRKQALGQNSAGTNAAGEAGTHPQKKEDKSHEKAKKPLPEAGPPHRGRRFEHREFAKLVGMGESTLSTRLNPKPEQKNNEWRHYEITAICRELHIPQEQIGEYFFPAVEKGETA